MQTSVFEWHISHLVVVAWYKIATQLYENKVPDQPTTIHMVKLAGFLNW